MLMQLLGSAGMALVLAGSVAAQTKPVKSQEPVSSGRPLSEWIQDLTAPAPQTRNAAAYEIAGMGPAAVAAVPALIATLDDPIAAVRFPAVIALMEIGPAAKAAVPRLQQMEEEEINDEIAAAARRALRRIQAGAAPPPP